MTAKVKNLEEEVDLIISEDEHDIVETRRSTRRHANITKTPSTQQRVLRNTKAVEKTPQTILVGAQTPRRSTRKSVRPPQDYDDIVTKSASKKLNLEGGHSDNENEPPQPKWTPAKVGRVSERRKTRNKKSSAKHALKKEGETHADDVVNDDEEKIEMPETQADAVIELKSEIEDGQSAKKSDRRSKRNRSKSVKKNSIVEDAELPQNLNEGEQMNQTADTNEVREVIGMKEEQHEEPVAKTVHCEVVEEKKSEVKIDVLESEQRRSIVPVEVAAKKVVAVDNSKSPKFGSYLQAFQDDLDDLGLNPLNEGSEDIDQTREQLQTYEDMPTLLIDDIAEDNILEGPSSPNNSSDTFNVSDSIVVANSPPDDQDQDCEMLTLQISDDDEDDELPQRKESPVKKKLPGIVLTNTNNEDAQLLGSPRVEMPSSAKVAHRLPTPHKKRNTVSEELNAIAQSVGQEKAPAFVELSVTTLEPKEIVLQGIRKRSLSMSVGDATKGSKGVRFYSPANQTVCCEDIDVKLAKSNKKIEPTRAEFVTQRRKRSLSFDESIMKKDSVATPSKIQRPTTPKSSNKKAPATRAKVPNFAAIHQKQFDKMENLVEHINRKTERAKLLTNSVGKQKASTTAPTQKLFSPRNANTATNRARAAATDDKPKALKRINLDTSNKSFTQTLSGPGGAGASATATAVLKRANEMHSLLDDDLNSLTAANMGNARLAYIKPAPTGKSIIYEATTKTATKSVIPRPIRKVLKPSQQSNAASTTTTTSTTTTGAANKSISVSKKPPFDLSTHLTENKSLSKTATNIFSTTTTAMAAAKLNMSTRIPQASTNAAATYDDKVAARRQRHMDMFKGRTANARVGLNATKQQNVQIRGVRSNRRFELQMQHRQNNIDNH